MWERCFLVEGWRASGLFAEVALLIYWGKEVQLGAVGARGRLELGGEKGAGSGSGLSQDDVQCTTTVDYHKTDQLLPPLYIPPFSVGVRAIRWSARRYNGQQVNEEGTMCTENVHRKCARNMCTENVHGFRTMAGTHRSRMGRSVPAHIVVFSLDGGCANSTLCVYQFSITIQLWTLWSPCLPAFNYFSIVAKLNARISMGLVCFQFAFTTQTFKSVV